MKRRAIEGKKHVNNPFHGKLPLSVHSAAEQVNVFLLRDPDI
jgi:hypothetical protein